MLIGELSTKSGFSRDTIRYYEKLGLIKVGRNDRRDNNYKEYSGTVLEQLLSIQSLKGFGFTLNEITEILSLMKGNSATCGYVSELVEQKVEIINSKIGELEMLKSRMQDRIASCCAPKNQKTDIFQNCPVL